VYGREKEGGLTALLHDTLNYHSSSGTHTQKSRDDNKRRASRFQLSLFPQHIFLLYKDTVSCFVLYFFCIFVFFYEPFSGDFILPIWEVNEKNAMPVTIFFCFFLLFFFLKNASLPAIYISIKLNVFFF
jgi:hypothetical protein